MQLRRGQKMALPDGERPVVVAVSGPAGSLTLGVVLLDAGRQPVVGGAVLGTAVTVADDGARRRVTIDPARLGPSVDRLALTADCGSTRARDLPFDLVIEGVDGAPIAAAAREELAAGDETALIVLELYRKAGGGRPGQQWRLALVGQGFAAGRSALAAHLGADPVDLRPAATAAPPPPPPPVAAAPPPPPPPPAPGPPRAVAPPPIAAPPPRAAAPPPPIAAPPPPAAAPPPPPPPPPPPERSPAAADRPGHPRVGIETRDRQRLLSDALFTVLRETAADEATERVRHDGDASRVGKAYDSFVNACSLFFSDPAFGRRADKAPEPEGTDPARTIAATDLVRLLDTRREQVQTLSTDSRQRPLLTARSNGILVKSLRAQSRVAAEAWKAQERSRHAEALARIAAIRTREIALTREAWGRLGEEVEASSPAWDSPRWSDWAAATEAPAVVRVGDMRVRQGPDAVQAPAVMPMGEAGLVLWGAHEPALGLVQDLMLRVLAQFPPGKARFVLVDPRGAGEAFAPFLHLSDFDDRLIGTKVWTDQSDIDAQLAELQGHVELVIQRYLRGEFDTIEEHNRAAGEVAEAYRFLVVVGFPSGFSEQAAQRLVSLARNGPRCGVIPIVVVDPTLGLPHGFDVNQLTGLCRVWTISGGQAVVRSSEADGVTRVGAAPAAVAPTTMTVHRSEPPPSLALTEPGRSPNAFTTVMRGIGSRSKAATTVQVSMGRLSELASSLMQGGRSERLPTAWPLPRPDDPSTWWHGSAAEDVSALVGRVGAQGVQTLHLSGSDTAVHALIAGRTGSGKTNLLHATILALATTYSPDEVELFLLDFKEGVEFKPYADEALPHARVVAIESEREFGLSVLQDLEAELARRGAAFRASGSTGLAAHRAATGRPLARQVLLIDEFHRLFPDEDKVAVECARILDLLVRQGRSFGIHVVLASQSLSGVAQVGRGTFSQIGVRVALQCEEADSRLIFSDDNPEASRLDRAGDAILNTANGRKEGNDPFQVVFVPPDQRHAIITGLRKRADAQGHDRVPVVFEGNAAVDLADCAPLRDLVARRAAPPADASVWVGSPISLAAPEPIRLRRRVGAHVLVVGSDDELVGGTAVAAAVGLAAQLDEGTDRRLTLLDFGALDDPVDLAFAAVDRATGPAVAAGRRAALVPTLAALAAEVTRRLDEGGRHPVHALVVHRLHAARDLRPDDYDADGPTPHDHLALILREGPEVGVHVVATTDGVSALARRVDDRLLEEMGHVVCFRIGADESLRLLDTDQASGLKGAQALVLDRDAVVTSKVRTFASPTIEQLETLLGLDLTPRST